MTDSRVDMTEHAKKCLDGGGPIKRNSAKAKKKSYAEDWDEDDDLFEGERQWSLEEKLASTDLNSNYVQVEPDGLNFNLGYFQEHGFKKPMLFETRAGLGIRVPSENFSVVDVKQCVGASRLVDVMDVITQKALVMKMRDWCAYYMSPNRERLLNVISLEFSHTKLDHYVESPTVVRQVDWVDRAWPLYLRQLQTDSTNDIDKMKYPKVRKYVLMSVGGCYTDFHIDFGGTSVWYHILRGEKIFWLIPPTEKNISQFEQWCLSGKQGDAFFGDLVGGACQRVHLKAGHTFMIPTGWIHAVYTPVDSLVFGGNFLHSFNTPLQFRVWQVEDKTHVKFKFRYPYYTELHWYVLARYVSCVLGVEHVVPLEDPDENGDIIDTLRKPDRSKIIDFHSPQWQHLTSWELESLRAIIKWISKLPPSRRYIPPDLPEPDSLLEDAQLLVSMHKSDDIDCAVTGQPLLRWPAHAEDKPSKSKAFVGRKSRGGGAPKLPKVKAFTEGGPQKRRIRCRVCEPCRRENCRECHFCKDMSKYGGTGTMKQCCIQKQCISPILPSSSCCDVCKEATRTSEEMREQDDYDPGTDLYECGICWRIVHPRCLESSEAAKDTPLSQEEAGVINNDMPNYWECSLCIRAGKKGYIKPRIPKGLAMLRQLERRAADGEEFGSSKKRGRPSASSAQKISPRAKKMRKSSSSSLPPNNDDLEDEDQEYTENSLYSQDPRQLSASEEIVEEVIIDDPDVPEVPIASTTNGNSATNLESDDVLPTLDSKMPEDDTKLEIKKDDDEIKVVVESSDDENTNTIVSHDACVTKSVDTRVSIDAFSDEDKVVTLELVSPPQVKRDSTSLTPSSRGRPRGRPVGSGGGAGQKRNSNGPALKLSAALKTPESIPSDDSITIRSSRREIHKPKRFINEKVEDE